MGNVFGKYAEWEVNDDGEVEGEVVEDIVVEQVDAPVPEVQDAPLVNPNRDVTEEPVVEENSKKGKTPKKESPKPKLPSRSRSNSNSDSNLKRKRTASFSNNENPPTVSIEEKIVQPEEPIESISTPVSEKRASKKRATSTPRTDNSLAVKAELVGGALPQIIDHQNYSRLSKEELVTQPRRSLRQTPLKDEGSNGDASPKSSVKKARAPKSPKATTRSPVKKESTPVNKERTPSPKRKLFSTPPKKEASPTPTKRGRKPAAKKGI